MQEDDEFDEEVDELPEDGEFDDDNEQYRLTLSPDNVAKVRFLVCAICRQPAGRRCGTCRGSTYYCAGREGEEHERHHQATTHNGDMCVPCISSSKSCNTCAICSEPGTLLCTVCNDTQYCSKEHLSQHKLSCFYSFEDMYLRQISDPVLDDNIEKFDQVKVNVLLLIT